MMNHRPWIPNVIAILMVGAITSSAEPKTPLTRNATDYPSLQAAIDALPSGGGTIVLPPGDFKLEQTLNLSFAAKNNPQFSVNIKGAGKLATRILLDTKGQPGLDFTGNSYWKVSDLHIMNRSANVGALLARTPANGRGCNGEFNNVFFSGCYPIAAVYLTGAECCRFWNCDINNQLKKWYNKDVEGMTEGEACVMVSPGNVRGLKSPYCEEGTGGGSNTEFLFDGCTFGNEAPESSGIKLFGQVSDVRIVNSYLHSDGFAAIYLDGTQGNLSNVALRDLRIEGEHGKHALYALGHVNLITIDGGCWNATEEVILQEGTPVKFVDAGGPCTSAVGAANKWKISQLSFSIWDGWGYTKEYRAMAAEIRGGPEKTAWKDDVPHVYMRFNQMNDSVVDPCELCTLRWRDGAPKPAGDNLKTVNGLTAEQAESISEASFMPGATSQKLRDRQRMLAIGKGSAGNRITVVSGNLLEADPATVSNNVVTILRRSK